MTTGDTVERVRQALGKKSGKSSDVDLNSDVMLPPGRKLRPCGVLIALSGGPNGVELILTKRSSALKHHPGQIAFPGGKVDQNDDGPVGAALREAQEEIGLKPDNVEVIGTLPIHETITGFTVTPVIALVRAGFEPVAEPGEVDEVFSVPLAHVTNPSQFQIRSRMWGGVRRRYYTVPYGPYYIWGATARILHGLAERMQP